MAWQDIAAKIEQGFAGAAGNTDAQAQVGQWQQGRANQQQDQLKMQIAPLTQAIQADRQKLTAFIDENGNVIEAHKKDYDATVKSMGEMLGRVRGLMGQKQPGEDPNHFESTIAGLTDKLHITRDLAHRLKTNQQQKRDQWGNTNTQMAQDTAAGTMPFAMTPEGQAEATKARDAQALGAQRAKSALDVANVRVDNKAEKGMKVMGTEALPIGLMDQDKGVQYLPSQLGPTGNAPPEYKEAWKVLQDQKAAKEEAENKKENDRITSQSRTLAAGFERMGMQQQFQELMRQYGSDLTEYRAVDKVARDSESLVKSLDDQYNAPPGSRAVADNMLQNFYTTVVQKGGRKTAAELKLTTQIGNLETNLKQKVDKITSGELPSQLRVALLDGMRAVAKEQREEANKLKPELPELPTPQGPKTKQLKQTTGANKDPLGVL